MSSIHGHEVLQMMLASGESWTVASLEAAKQEDAEGSQKFSILTELMKLRRGFI